MADNQAFEAGAVAGRSLLSFLGIDCDREGILKKDQNRFEVEGMTDDVKAPDVGGSFVDLDSLSEDEKSLLGRFIRGVNKSSAHFTWRSRHGLDVQTYYEAACLIQRLLRDHLPQGGVLTPSEIKAARDYVEELIRLVNGIALPPGLHLQIAGILFGIAQEHHDATIRLLAEDLNGSAFALLRSVFEAYVRGEWIALRADETWVNRFLEGGYNLRN
jgi:hypothetical protein